MELTATQSLTMMPVGKIRPDPKQPRKHLRPDSEEVVNMAHSLQANGLINPIIIDNDNVIIVGEIRWLASKLAGLKEIPVRIVNVQGTERTIMQLAENLARNDMTPSDTARAISKLSAGVQNSRELAKKLGKSHSFVVDMLDLARETPAAKEAVESGEVPYTALRDANAFPEQHRDKVREKVLTGKIKRDALKPLNHAVKTNPALADELLAEDYSGPATDSIAKIKQIAPPEVDPNLDKFEKAKRISAACNQLVRALEALPVDELGFEGHGVGSSLRRAMLATIAYYNAGRFE